MTSSGSQLDLEPAPFDFRGGMRLGPGEPSQPGPVSKPNLPDRLYIELQPGDQPCVRIGTRVLTHQRLTHGLAEANVPSHAPTSGRIADIAMRPSSAANAGQVASLIIEVDGMDEAMGLDPIADLSGHTPADLIKRIRDAGVTGMGGAGFATHRKLGEARQTGVDTLVINAAECEPGVRADSALLIDDPELVVRGAVAVAEILGARRCLVGIEPDNAKAFAALRSALAARPEDGVSWRCYGLPERYPAGSERSLIRALTGIQLQHGERPPAHRLICFNVATLYAVARALYHGEPLTRRVLSVSGQGATDPGEHWAYIGQPIGEFQAAPHFQALHGGALAGWPVDGAAAVGKTTFSLHFRQRPELTPDPCIRCQRCADVCPEPLYPERLLRHSRALNVAGLRRDGLDRCVECGACDIVCPSRIPLLATFRETKSTLASADRSTARAADARIRHQSHETRESARQRASEASREARLNRRRPTHEHP